MKPVATATSGIRIFGNRVKHTGSLVQGGQKDVVAAAAQMGTSVDPETIGHLRDVRVAGGLRHCLRMTERAAVETSTS